MRYRPEYNPKVIGENLKRLRLANHLSVKALQEYLRLGTPQAYYKYENGSGYPQSDTLLALMELYGAEVRDIVVDYKKLQEKAVQKLAVFWEDKTIVFTKIIFVGEYREGQKKHMTKYYELLQVGKNQNGDYLSCMEL